MIGFWACFPDRGHKLNKFHKLSDKNKTWQPLQVLAALKGLLNSFTWLLLKDGLVLGCAQPAPHRADSHAGEGLSCWFPWKSHSWSLDTAMGTRWGFVIHVWCSSTQRHWAKQGGGDVPGTVPIFLHLPIHYREGWAPLWTSWVCKKWQESVKYTREIAWLISTVGWAPHLKTCQGF